MSIEHGSMSERIEELIKKDISNPKDNSRWTTISYVVEEIRKRTGSEDNLFALSKDTNNGNSREIQIDLGLGNNGGYRVRLFSIPRYDDVDLSICKVDDEGLTGDIYYIGTDASEVTFGGMSMSEGGSERRRLEVDAKQFAELLSRALENTNTSNWRLVS